MHILLWPNGLVGRMTAVILAALVLEFIGSIALHDQVDRYTVREDHARRIAELLVVSERLMGSVEPARRAAMLETLSTQHLTVQLKPNPIAEPNSKRLAAVRARIVDWEPSLAQHDLRIGAEVRDLTVRRDDLVGAMRLDDGSWLHFRSRDISGHWPMLYRTFGTAAILAVGVLLCSAVLIQFLAAPLRALAQAANHVGEGVSVRLSERGPHDLNQVAQAFNLMQGRIARLISDRTLAFAAVSHDLRTPLARLRLRSDMISSPEEREAIGADITEMEAMLDSVLAFLGGDSDPEAPRLVDLAVLVSTLADTDADAGRAVSYSGPDHLLAKTRPVNLKRAVGNLVENALKYGGCARVSLDRTDAQIRIVVDDNGPGIPEADLKRVIQPFLRLDAARQRDTSGLGLGLSIVSRIVEREGGRLRLGNRPEGGLRAEIFLPNNGG